MHYPGSCFPGSYYPLVEILVPPEIDFISRIERDICVSGALDRVLDESVVLVSSVALATDVDRLCETSVSALADEVVVFSCVDRTSDVLVERMASATRDVTVVTQTARLVWCTVGITRTHTATTCRTPVVLRSARALADEVLITSDVAVER